MKDCLVIGVHWKHSGHFSYKKGGSTTSLNGHIKKFNAKKLS